MKGLGTDIVAVERIAGLVERHGERFLARCFSSAERAVAERRGRRGAEALAGRWAAKEAFIKALGAAGEKVAMHDIQVVSGPEGAPSLDLKGSAAAALAEIGGGRVLVSISHESEYAVAVVAVC